MSAPSIIYRTLKAHKLSCKDLHKYLVEQGMSITYKRVTEYCRESNYMYGRGEVWAAIDDFFDERGISWHEPIKDDLKEQLRADKISSALRSEEAKRKTELVRKIANLCRTLDVPRLEEMYEAVKVKWYDCNAEMTFERVGYRIPLSPAKTKDE